MRLQRQSNGQFITFDHSLEIGAGGEARVYAVAQDRSLVAKVYHKPTDIHARKLATMLANPPDDPMAGQGHVSIAWPVDLLHTADDKQQVVGFLMPRVTGMYPIIDFYNPGTRRRQCPLFNYLYLHRTARNLAAAVRALHARGYVIGDVNESNILVTDTALVTLVDTDSFQVYDPQYKVVYRCPVGKPEFTPPELQRVKFAEVDRTPEHDLFGLGVLTFQLLMEGVHPFAGVFTGQGDAPPLEERISDGHFPYRKKRRMRCRPMPGAPPFEILHPSLRKLFMRCFKNGHKHPNARPDAQTWQNALNTAENSLDTCFANNQHYYGKHLNPCPWCQRTAQLNGRDPFPSPSAVQGSGHLQAVPPIQRPLPPAGAGQAPSSPTTQMSQSGHATTTTPLRQTVPGPNKWSWGAFGFALLTLLLPLPLWTGLAAAICGRVGLHRAQALGGRGKRMATSALAIGCAMLFTLFSHRTVPDLTSEIVQTLTAFGNNFISVRGSEDIDSGEQTQIQPPQLDEMEARYKNALRLYNENRYAEALKAFQRLTQSNIPHRYLIGNAHYWSGMCYMKRGQLQDALTEFQQVAAGNSYKDWDARNEMQKLSKMIQQNKRNAGR